MHHLEEGNVSIPDGGPWGVEGQGPPAAGSPLGPGAPRRGGWGTVSMELSLPRGGPGARPREGRAGPSHTAEARPGQCWPHGTWPGREVQVETRSPSSLLLPCLQAASGTFLGGDTSKPPAVPSPPVPPALSPRPGALSAPSCHRLSPPHGSPSRLQAEAPFRAPSECPSRHRGSVPDTTPLSFPGLLTPPVVIPPRPPVSGLSAPRALSTKKGAAS